MLERIRLVRPCFVAALALAVLASACDDGAPGGDEALDASHPDGGDPCVGVEQCAVLGTFCDGARVVSCAENASGCWVITEALDCAQFGLACDAQRGDCVDNGELCAGRPDGCEAAGTRCEDSQTLVRCATEPASGCLVETRQSCAASGTRCASGPDGQPACTSDPCAAENACSEPGLSCDGTDLVGCAADATTGCLVATRTSCAESGQSCRDDGTSVACVEACAGVATCGAATQCDGDLLVTCAPDADGCLVPSATTDCAQSGQSCETDAQGGAACTTSLCPQRLATLSCTDTLVSGHTSAGSTSFERYCGLDFVYPASEAIYAFRNTETAQVTVRASGFDADYDLFALDGSGRACNDTSITDCLDRGTLEGSAVDEAVDFVIAPSQTVYLSLDRYESSGTSAFQLEILCTPVVCGDGRVSLAEGCDDGNTVAGDGCAADCTVEPGQACIGEPSSCYPQSNGDRCAAPIPLGDGVSTWSTAGLGDDYGDYRGSCGTQQGDGPDMVFAVTLAPGRTLDLVVSPAGGFDAVVALSTGCPQINATCQVAADDPEALVYRNETSATQTVYIMVDGYWSDDAGSFDLDLLTY